MACAGACSVHYRSFTAAALSFPQTTTPEYLPPELVALTTTAVSAAAVRETLRDSSSPHATDMWSVGAVLLGTTSCLPPLHVWACHRPCCCVLSEIMCGFPLWMPYTSRVEKGGKDHMLSGGLFAVPQRNPAKIVARQITYVVCVCVGVVVSVVLCVGVRAARSARIPLLRLPRLHAEY